MRASIIVSLALTTLTMGSLSLASPAPTYRITLQRESDAAEGITPRKARKKHVAKSKTKKKRVKTGQVTNVAAVSHSSPALQNSKRSNKTNGTIDRTNNNGPIQNKPPKTETDSFAQQPHSSYGSISNNTSASMSGLHGTTTTSVNAAPVGAAPKSPFTFRIRDYTAMDMSGVDNAPGSDREARAWDRIDFTYAFNKDISATVMPQFFHSWFGVRDRPQDGDGSTTGLSQPYSGYLGNTALILTDSKLANLSNGFVMDAQVRYDIPTSEQSQAQGSGGETWLTAGLGKSVGIFDFKITEIFRWYIQQYNTSSVVKTAGGLNLQNPYARLYSLLDIGINITKKLVFTLETGFRNERRLADPDTGRPEVMIDCFVLQPDIGYAFNDNFSLNLGIWETPDMRAMTATYVPLSSDAQNNGEAYLLTTIKF